MKIVKTRVPFWRHGMKNYYSTKESNIGYIPIPKNASWFMRLFLGLNIGWDPYHNDTSYIFNYEKEKRDKFIVVLRDPYERWISGVLEYVRFTHDAVSWESKHVLDFICHRIVLDDHTEPQVNFIEGLDTENIIFFKVDKNLEYNLSNFLITSKLLIGDVIKIPPPTTNRQEDDSKKTNLIYHLELFLKNNPERVDRIKNFYRPDYDLINSVKFYEAD